MVNISKVVGKPESALQEDGYLARTLVLALGTFSVGTDAFIVAGFLPAMAASLNVTPAQAGTSMTVFAATYALLAPVIATLVTRVPRRTLLVAALVLLGLANIGSALSPSLAMLLVTRVLAATAAASYTPTAGAVSVMLVRPEFRARALSVVIGGLTIATAIGVPLGNVASLWFGWRTAFALVGGLALLAGLGVWIALPWLAGNAHVALRTRLAVLRFPQVYTVLPLTALGMAACYTPYAYSVPVLEAVGVQGRLVAAMLVVYGLGAMLGNIVSGQMTDRLGTLPVLLTVYLLMALTLGIFGWQAMSGNGGLVLTGVLMLLWGATSWSQSPPQQHRLIAAAPHEASLVVALNSSAIYSGIGLGALLGGSTIGGGVDVMFGLGTVLACLAAGYCFMTRGCSGNAPGQ